MAKSILEYPIYFDFVRRYQNDPVSFCREICGTALSQDQIRFANKIAARPDARVSVVSGTGCFAKGTELLRFNGESIKVEDVQIGMKMLGKGNEPRTVKRLIRGKEEMFKLTLSSGQSWVFNKSHDIVCLFTKTIPDFGHQGDISKLSIEEYLSLSEKQQKSLRFVLKDSVPSHNKKLPIDPYILGLWLGDGAKDQPIIFIAEKDKELINHINDYAKANGFTTKVTKEKSACYRVRINGGFKQILRECNLLDNKHIPEIYMNSNRRAELLAGLMDTDGHLAKDGLRFEFACKEDDFAEQVVELANKCGHLTKRTERIIWNYYKGTKNYFTYNRIYISKNLSRIPNKSIRRQQKREDNTDLSVKIKKVESLGIGDYYGFEVDGDQIIVLNNGYLTGNTGKTALLARIALWFLLCKPVAKYAGKTEVGSNVYVGAPRLNQVSSGIMKEIGDVVSQWSTNDNLSWLSDFIVVQDEVVHIKHHKKTWFLRVVALPPKNAVSIAGKHRFHQLIIVDEAAGVSDETFDVINGTQTQAGNITVLVSQGVKQEGFFYLTHSSLSKENGGVWDTMEMSSLNSPFTSDAWIEQVVHQAGGIDTPEFKVRVLGKFADTENSTLISRDDMDNAFKDTAVINEGDLFGYLLLADVGAGEYRDESVLFVAKVYKSGDMGDEARRVEFVSMPVCSNSIDPNDFAGRIMEEYMKHSNATVMIDAGGIGLAVIKTLEKEGIRVRRINWGAPCFKQEYKSRFYNQRACALVRFRDALKQGRIKISIPLSTKLKERIITQGTKIPYSFTEQGMLRYKIMSKESMREKGIRSPDMIDAMSFAFLESAHYSVAEDSIDLPISKDLIKSVASKFDDL